MEPHTPHEERTSSIQPQDSRPTDKPPSPKQRLSTPVAIIIAGIIIAGAVIYTNKDGGGAREEQPQSLAQIVKKLKINKSKFETCVEERRHKDRVQSDLDAGIAAGSAGTPYSIVLLKDGRTNASAIPGAQPPEVVKKVIDDALAGKLDNEKIKLSPLSEKDHVRGDRNAQVVIIEYSDLQCPFCQRFHGTMNEVMRGYKPEQVAWVFRHFPLDSIHQNARPLAEASECAYELGGDKKFWEFIDALFGY